MTKKSNYAFSKTLQSYNGKTSTIPFASDITCRIGTIEAKMPIGLQNLDGVGIMGIDAMRELGIIIDLPNRRVLRAEKHHSDAAIVISSVHCLGAIKASEDLKIPTWDDDIQEAIKDHLAVFARHKQSCGKTLEVVDVPGPDPRPMKQYRYPVEAEKGIEETITNLVSQGVLINTQSPCNSPIWPVIKADGKTWRLTVDYRGVNKVTPRMAPVVAKFPEIMAQIAEGARWFSVLDISNAFFSIPIATSAWHKFAFTFRD